MVFEPQSYISYRFMWLSSSDAGWWDMFGTRYTIFGWYVLSENVSGITPLMISEVDPMENCESLFSGKQWYFICNWWLLIGIPTNTPSANLSLSPKPSRLLCHPIDSTEVGVQHPAHHLQKPDLFSQGSTAWYWCDKIDFEHITKSRRWTTVHHIAPQKLNIFGCLPHGCRSFTCFPKKALDPGGFLSLLQNSTRSCQSRALSLCYEPGEMRPWIADQKNDSQSQSDQLAWGWAKVLHFAPLEVLPVSQNWENTYMLSLFADSFQNQIITRSH